jgi:hypothetical protein
MACLFVDLGGVLLTNGWDHTARKRAGKKFNLDYAEMEERHDQTFDTYEEGKLTLDEYLRRVESSFGGDCASARLPMSWPLGQDFSTNVTCMFTRYSTIFPFSTTTF